MKRWPSALLHPSGLVVRTFYGESQVQTLVTTFSLSVCVCVCVCLFEYILATRPERKNKTEEKFSQVKKSSHKSQP